jgi:hypothetical protein
MCQFQCGKNSDLALIIDILLDVWPLLGMGTGVSGLPSTQRLRKGRADDLALKEQIQCSETAIQLAIVHHDNDGMEIIKG